MATLLEDTILTLEQLSEVPSLDKLTIFMTKLP